VLLDQQADYLRAKALRLLLSVSKSPVGNHRLNRLRWLVSLLSIELRETHIRVSLYRLQ
jgi:hypothetical protein